MKKAQITIFIIIGILLLFASVALVSIKGPKEKTPAEGKNPVTNYVESCIEQTAESGLFLLGIHGGRIYGLDDANNANGAANDVDSDVSNVGVADNVNAANNVFAKDNMTIMYAVPSLAESQADLQRYIAENLSSCLNNLSAFKEEFDRIEIGAISSAVMFGSENTLVKVNMPIKLQKNDAITNLDEFSSDLKIRYKKVRDFVTVLASFSDRWNLRDIVRSEFNVNFMQYSGQEEGFYIIEDPKSMLKNKRYVFLSAIKESGGNAVCSEE